MRLLIVEDDKALAAALAQGFREEGFAVDVALDGAEGLDLASTAEHDVAILDLMLPRLNGFELLQKLRSEGNAVPAIFLTARDAVEDRVKGLKLGGDDYVTKPFAFEELLARVRSVLRRAAGASGDRLEWGDLVLDAAARTALWQGKEIALTPKELSLLEALLLHKGKAVSRTRLIQHTYDFAFDRDSNVIDVHVANLRRKLSQATGLPIVETVRGMGFRIPKEVP
jgi:DNA-binding response OmpR family regulator